MNNDLLIEVLESYMEFVDIMDKTLVRKDLPSKLRDYARLLVVLRQGQWQPVLKKLKQEKEEQCHTSQIKNYKHS